MPQSSQLTEFLTHVGTRGFSRHKYLVVEDRDEAIATLADWFNGQGDAELGRRGVGFFTDGPGVSWDQPWVVKVGRNRWNCIDLELMSKCAATGHPLIKACEHCSGYRERPDPFGPMVTVCRYHLQHARKGSDDAAVFEGWGLGLIGFYENASVVVIDFDKWPVNPRTVDFARLKATNDPVVAALVAAGEALCQEIADTVEVTRSELISEEPFPRLIDSPQSRTSWDTDYATGRFKAGTLRQYLTDPSFESVIFEWSPITEKIVSVHFTGDVALPGSGKLTRKAIIVVDPSRTDVTRRLETIGVQQYFAQEARTPRNRGPHLRLTSEQRATLPQLREEGLTNEEIGDLYDVHGRTIQREFARINPLLDGHNYSV